jgi:hypothetical protein
MNNNDPKFEKFIFDLENIKMTSTEKSKLRQSLLSFAIQQDYKQQQIASLVSPFKLIFKKSLAFAFIGVLTLGSLTQVGAAYSLPGDVLYPVKIAQEEVVLKVQRNDEEKINYQIKRTEKRIQEATSLAQKGDIDIEIEKKIAENIQKQTQEVHNHISKIQESNPEKALAFNTEFKSTIKVNSEILKKVSGKKSRKQRVREELPLNETTTLGSIETQPIMAMMADVQTETVVNDGVLVFSSLEENLDMSILDIIDDSIEIIEQKEVEITQEIIKEETPKEEIPVEAETTPSPIQIVSEEEESIKPETETEEAAIYTLEKVIEMKETIQKLKGDQQSFEKIKEVYIDEAGETKERIVFDEEILSNEAQKLIEERSYEQAFLVLQKIHEYFKSKEVALSAQRSLGVTLEASFLAPSQ